MFYQQTLLSLPNATFSQESEVGATPCDSRGGQTASQSGLDHALASLSARQAKALGLLTSGIYGRHSSTSSSSADLQSCLANRLQQLSTGSTLFKLTWKQRATPSGRLICALRASARRISDKDSTGLPKTLPTPSGTSSHGKNHVAGRLDEWGGSSNPFRGKEIGKVHCPTFELWVMGYPAAWLLPTVQETLSSRK